MALGADQGTKQGKESSPYLRLGVDLGPLLTFFGVYFLADDLYIATGAYIVVTIAALTASWLIERRIAPMPLITGVIVLFFGGLTIYLQNDQFIKMKPTVINLLFAGILFGGLMTGRKFLKYLFQDAFALNEDGWRLLTIRWTCFFVFLAILNEVVWRNFSEAFWVSFKIWGVLPLTIVFTALQVPLIQKHAIDFDDDSEQDGSDKDLKT